MNSQIGPLTVFNLATAAKAKEFGRWPRDKMSRLGDRPARPAAPASTTPIVITVRRSPSRRVTAWVAETRQPRAIAAASMQDSIDAVAKVALRHFFGVNVRCWPARHERLSLIKIEAGLQGTYRASLKPVFERPGGGNGNASHLGTEEPEASTERQKTSGAGGAWAFDTRKLCSRTKVTTI